MHPCWIKVFFYYFFSATHICLNMSSKVQCDLGRSRERANEKGWEVRVYIEGGERWTPVMAVFPCRRARRVVSEEDVKRGATPLCSALLCDTHSAHPNIPAAKCGAQYNCRLAELQMRPAAQLRTDRQRGLAELYHGNSSL